MFDHVIAPARARNRFFSVVLAVLVALVPVLVGGAAPASAVNGTLSFVASASTAGNRTSHTVTVPAGVRAGDTLVLFLTTNAVTSTINNTVAGWTLLQQKNGTDTRGRAWTKQASATDAGSKVTVTTSAAAKSVISVSAYRSSLGSSKVTASASAVVNTAATRHTAPAVAVSTAGSWLVSSWNEKSSTAVTWTAPTGTTVRTRATGTGTGKVSGIVGDSNAAVATGTAAARTATTSASVGRSVEFSVVVAPGTATTTNRAPVASFTSSCPALTCAFDATGSTDPDGNTLSYSWTFDDGSTATGATPSHTYASAGSRSVTLTVSDGTLTNQKTTTVTVSAPPPVTTMSKLPPTSPRTDMPKISDGEIWDIELVGNRVFIAGSFTSIQNQRPTDTTTYAQAGLAAYNIDTGLVDTSFRPVFGGGGVQAVEASPDGTKLYVAGNFSTVNGLTRKGVVRLDPATGATVTGFTANTDAMATELAATNSTVYIGGRFTKVNGVDRSALAAVDATTGALDTGFVNNITGGIGTNGELTVQRLKLTHDLSKLLVVHTGRQVNGQDRYGVALIDTSSKQLLPWRTHLWEDNLQFVGGIQRVYGGDISPDDTYFVVSSGSGGDRPPINDTVIRFPIAGGDNVQPAWVSRHFDSVYSVAIADNAVYVGGHFSWEESPSAPDPWPGLDDVGYGNGQGLSGYGLGDAVVRRDHISAVNPVDGKALDWNPGSNSFEGNKAMEVTSRGLFTGGDAVTQGGYNVGRVAWYDPSKETPGNGVDTTITEPIEGRVEPAGTQFTIQGTATATGGVKGVAVEVLDRDSKQYLQDDLTTWGPANTIPATLTPAGATTDWSLPLTITGNHRFQVLARTTAVSGTADPTKATKKFETFGLSDRTPTATISSPAASVVTTETFTVAGTAADDVGVTGVTLTLRDSQNRYLQDDGTVGAGYNALRITPDVVGATSTTWSREITVPYEDTWKAQARSTDTAGQTSVDTADRTWIVSSTGQAPVVSISAPAAMVPPTAAQPVTVTPGQPLTFSGSANDDGKVTAVDIALVNTTTHEQLASDGTWGKDSVLAYYRISPAGLSQASYAWRYTTPFNLTPGNYTFRVRAIDDLGITTSTANSGALTLTAVIPGDAPPKASLTTTGTVSGLQSLHLDLTGSALDDVGVNQVLVSVKEQASGRYLQPDGTSLSAAYATLPATLAAKGATSTSWSLPLDLPVQGSWLVTAVAKDTAGQQDTSNAGATATYAIYPGDVPPTLTDALLAPTEGTVFPDGRIFISGRAEDDQAMARVDVAVTDGQGRYMSASGTFTSTTPSWRASFLTSPGTPGSNFSYTTPVLPAGAYTVQIRGVDQHGLITPTPATRHVTVNIPPGNLPPVAAFTVSCVQNVCTFDGRTSTDENTPTLTYAWDFGNGTGTGPLPTRTYTSAKTYAVTLTVKDEWGATATQTKSVTITEPTGNVAPKPVINPPACAGLSCNFSGVGSADPNVGDTFTYAWDFKDGSPASTSTSTAPTHTFPAAGTYPVQLTVTDGWGKAQSTTLNITVPAP